MPKTILKHIDNSTHLTFYLKDCERPLIRPILSNIHVRHLNIIGTNTPRINPFIDIIITFPALESLTINNMCFCSTTISMFRTLYLESISMGECSIRYGSAIEMGRSIFHSRKYLYQLRIIFDDLNNPLNNTITYILRKIKSFRRLVSLEISIELTEENIQHLLKLKEYKGLHSGNL